MKLLIPCYWYPDANTNDQRYKDWETIFANQEKIWGCIVNVNSGPGPANKDSNYVKLIARLKLTGMKIFGYVASDYARTYPVEQCIEHVKLWESLWGVTDIFVDEAGSSEDKIPFYTALHAAIKGVSILNHGVIPDYQYLTCGSILCTAETSWANLRDNEFPEWATERENPGRFYHIAMATVGGDISAALKFMSDKSEFVYVSDHVEPKVFKTLPTYWSRLLGQIQMYATPPAEATPEQPPTPSPSTENTATMILIQTAKALPMPEGSTLKDVPDVVAQQMVKIDQLKSQVAQLQAQSAVRLGAVDDDQLVEELRRRLTER